MVNTETYKYISKVVVNNNIGVVYLYKYKQDV